MCVCVCRVMWNVVLDGFWAFPPELQVITVLCATLATLILAIAAAWGVYGSSLPHLYPKPLAHTRSDSADSTAAFAAAVDANHGGGGGSGSGTGGGGGKKGR